MKIPTCPDFIGRTIRVMQCTETETNRWYEQFIGATFTVTENAREHFYVDEYEIKINRCVPLTIKKGDCVIVE